MLEGKHYGSEQCVSEPSPSTPNLYSIFLTFETRGGQWQKVENSVPCSPQVSVLS